MIEEFTELREGVLRDTNNVQKPRNIYAVVARNTHSTAGLRDLLGNYLPQDFAKFVYVAHFRPPPNSNIGGVFLTIRPSPSGSTSTFPSWLSWESGRRHPC